MIILIRDIIYNGKHTKLCILYNNNNHSFSQQRILKLYNNNSFNYYFSTNIYIYIYIYNS